LLVKLRVALAAPVTCGLKFTVKGKLCPAGTSAGKDKPLIVNRELFALAAVIVTSAPLALRLPEAVSEVPMTTFPTPKVAGVADNCGATVVPVPAAAMLKDGLDPFDVMVTVPLALPVVCGVNVTVKEKV